MRSASGFGAHGVVIPERRAARMTAAAWKTSAGAAARIPVAHATNLVRTLKEFQDAGCQVVGLAADGDLTLPDLLADPDLASGPLVVVVGSEGDGLGRLVSRDLRPARLHPDVVLPGVAQRRRRRLHHPLRPLPPSLTLHSVNAESAQRDTEGTSSRRKQTQQ